MKMEICSSYVQKEKDWEEARGRNDLKEGEEKVEKIDRESKRKGRRVADRFAAAERPRDGLHFLF